MVKNVAIDGTIYLDKESVRLTRKSWTELLLWGRFQYGHRNTIPKIKYVEYTLQNFKGPGYYHHSIIFNIKLYIYWVLMVIVNA